MITLILCSLAPWHNLWASDITLNIAGHRVQATIANTPYSRQHGLMQNTQLCQNCGMLFIFPQAERHRFWMKDTPLALSIAFIAANGSILNIDEMQANTTAIHIAQGNALYALEMNKGWFIEKNIKTQDLVQGLQKAPLGK